MTTIAYRDGVLAADTLVTVQTHRDGHTIKIRKRGPFLAAASGCYPIALAFLDWFSAGMAHDKLPDMTGGDDDKYGSSGKIFMPDGLILSLTGQGWTHKRAPFYAVGSGQDYCYGAFSMGATAEQAVRSALEHETASGGEITVMRHAN